MEPEKYWLENFPLSFWNGPFSADIRPFSGDVIIWDFLCL